MTYEFRREHYKHLNSRQQENYNFLKISAILADYGFMTLRLNDDWQNADFIAQHIDGSTFLKVQLKGRFTIEKKYLSKDLWIAFRRNDHCYLYPHDIVVEEVLNQTQIGDTDAWAIHGGYSYSGLTKLLEKILEPYRLPARDLVTPQ